MSLVVFESLTWNKHADQEFPPSLAAGFFQVGHSECAEIKRFSFSEKPLAFFKEFSNGSLQCFPQHRSPLSQWDIDLASFNLKHWFQEYWPSKENQSFEVHSTHWRPIHAALEALALCMPRPASRRHQRWSQRTQYTASMGSTLLKALCTPLRVSDNLTGCLLNSSPLV